MPTLIAAGVFCPLDGVAGIFAASDWRLAAQERFVGSEADRNDPVVLFEDGIAGLPDLLAGAPTTRAIILHISREEAIAFALQDDGDLDVALERWRVCALEQVSLFRQMRDRVVLVPLRRFEAAPEIVLGEAAPAAPIKRFHMDPLALAIASAMTSQLPQPDRAASLLTACIREEHRVEPILDFGKAASSWRRMTAMTEEIRLLRKHLAQMQDAFETAQPQREGDLVEAERETDNAHSKMPPEHDKALAEREQEMSELREWLAASIAAQAETERLRKNAAAQTEEIGLLREHLAQLQPLFETTWLQKEESRASASRQPPVHRGLTMPVDLSLAARPAP